MAVLFISFDRHLSVVCEASLLVWAMVASGRCWIAYPRRLSSVGVVVCFFAKSYDVESGLFGRSIFELVLHVKSLASGCL